MVSETGIYVLSTEDVIVKYTSLFNEYGDVLKMGIMPPTTSFEKL